MGHDFDYWMLGVISEAIHKAKDKQYVDRHRGCSYLCDNRWCSVGQRNLIIKRIDKIQSDVSDRFQEISQNENTISDVVRNNEGRVKKFINERPMKDAR